MSHVTDNEGSNDVQMDGKDTHNASDDAFHRRLLAFCCGVIFGYMAGAASVSAKQKAASYDGTSDGSDDIPTGNGTNPVSESAE